MGEGFADDCLTIENTIVNKERLPSSRPCTSFLHVETVSLKFIAEGRQSTVTMLTFTNKNSMAIVRCRHLR